MKLSIQVIGYTCLLLHLLVLGGGFCGGWGGGVLVVFNLSVAPHMIQNSLSPTPPQPEYFSGLLKADAEALCKVNPKNTCD